MDVPVIEKQDMDILLKRFEEVEQRLSNVEHRVKDLETQSRYPHPIDWVGYE
jgi:hypothetical protein